MSDLAATNCGCECTDNNGCSNLIWLILILCCCGNDNGGMFGRNGNGSGCDYIWLILILCCCCGNNGGNGFF